MIGQSPGGYIVKGVMVAVPFSIYRLIPYEEKACLNAIASLDMCPAQRAIDHRKGTEIIVVAAKRAARRDGVRVFRPFLWLKPVPAKRCCLVPSTSGYPHPHQGASQGCYANARR